MRSAYEQRQFDRIQAWCAEPPTMPTRLFAKATGPAASAVQRVIPVALLRKALDTVQRVAIQTADRASILKRAGVGELDDLRATQLEICDGLAAQVQARGVALAGGTGAMFGIAGAFGLAADIPTLLLQAFRVIHRTGLCYGEDCTSAEKQRLTIAIFALASANSVAEKQAALAAIATVSDVHTAAWRDGIERTAEREFAKEAAIYSLNNLSKTLAERFGLRKAVGGVPVFGAVVGGAVNALYLRDIAKAAQIAFQQRWLAERAHEEAPPPLPSKPQRKRAPRKALPADS
ncbi:MAG: EcsC family protein [Nevskia sp.]|jgi:hypothetical protein|nr:EcsC family protein [Nevskia sp.]MCK9384817.1 EcsC family protein [Nevskia sp.]